MWGTDAAYVWIGPGSELCAADGAKYYETVVGCSEGDYAGTYCTDAVDDAAESGTVYACADSGGWSDGGTY